ncbi:MAG TPA: laccase, partial [Cyanobacteria bacterium UBA11366]|nr:laccase [Cyanobacteria bacterium UBA11366]
GASIIPQDKADSPESILEFLRQLPDSPVLEDPEPGKIRLDVRRVNGIQLEQLGLQAEQIAIAPYCTYQEPDFFFSYRRDRLKNVQWSGIVSNYIS